MHVICRHSYIYRNTVLKLKPCVLECGQMLWVWSDAMSVSGQMLWVWVWSDAMSVSVVRCYECGWSDAMSVSGQMLWVWVWSDAMSVSGQMLWVWEWSDAMIVSCQMLWVWVVRYECECGQMLWVWSDAMSEWSYAMSMSVVRCYECEWSDAMGVSVVRCYECQWSDAMSVSVVRCYACEFFYHVYLIQDKRPEWARRWWLRSNVPSQCCG